DDVDAPGGDPLVVNGLQAGFGRAVEDDAFQRLRRRTLGFGWRLRAGGGGRCEQQEAEAGGGGGVQAGVLVTWWRERCDGFPMCAGASGVEIGRASCRESGER